MLTDPNKKISCRYKWLKPSIQVANPDNFAHEVRFSFSLQNKPSFLGQPSCFIKAQCSYHLKCEPTAHTVFYKQQGTAKYNMHNSNYLL